MNDEIRHKSNPNGDAGSEKVKNSSAKSPDMTRLLYNLEKLASIKVGEELIGRADSDDQGLGFKEHLGYGQTDITIESIKGEKLHLYVTKDSKNNPTGYYITSKGEASLRNKYNITENLHDITSYDAELIDKLERNFYRIKWDLPNIHAIKTAEKTKAWTDGEGNTHNDPNERSEVLITDQEEKIKEKINSSSTGQPTKTWTAAHPWAPPEFDISSDKRDSEEPPKEQKLMYKALHGEISDETEKGGISSADLKILNDIDTHAKKTFKKESACKNPIVEKEKEILKEYYNSDRCIRKEYKRKYTEYTKQLMNQIKSKDKPIQKETFFSSIEKSLGEILEKLTNLQSIIHNAITRSLGLTGKHKIFINRDLFLRKNNSGDNFILTDKKPNEDSVPVSVDLLENIGDPNKIQCDLTVCAIQPPKQTNPDSSLKDKEPEILVTDDRSLVEKKIKDGWTALSGAQTEIIEPRSNKIVLQGLNNITDESAGKQKELESFTKNALEEKPLEQDKKVIINNKRNDIFKQLNDKFANSLKKLPGWDILEIGMDIKVSGDREATIYSDEDGIYYIADLDSTKLTQSGTKLQRQDLSGLNPSMLDGENVQWVVPEIHAMQKLELDAERNVHTRIIFTNDKNRYEGDHWKHLGTCDSFLSSKNDIIKNTFLNICRAEYRKMCLYYYQQYDLYKNSPVIIEVERKFQEHKNLFSGFLEGGEIKDIETKVIKELKMRTRSKTTECVDLNQKREENKLKEKNEQGVPPNGEGSTSKTVQEQTESSSSGNAKSEDETLEKPNGVANSSTDETSSDKQPKADRPSEVPRQAGDSIDSGDNTHSALKNAMRYTRTLHQWATRFQSRFDLSEDWVKKGIGNVH
jgi:hypothetical protein